MLDSVSNEINNYKRFEECIVKIFEEAEYDTVSNVVLEQHKGDIDIVAKKMKRSTVLKLNMLRLQKKQYIKFVQKLKKMICILY